MRIKDLERAIRNGVKAYPGQQPSALLATGGPAHVQLPAEFIQAADMVASRDADGEEVPAITTAYGRWF